MPSTHETKPDFWFSQQCLAVIFDKIGRHADAELEWLETALRLRDPGLLRLKVEPLLDPLRNEPRFQALMQKLKFPS